MSLITLCRRACQVVLVSAAVIPLACDPGVRYVPRGWSSVGDHRWAYQNEEFRAVVITPGALVLSKSFVLEPEITNLSTQPLVFERATITSGDRTYAGEFGGGNRLDVRTVDAGDSKRMPIYFFNLDKAIPEALGKHFQMLVSYRLGDGDPKEVRFEFTR